MEMSKCHGCHKEDFETAMYTLGKKWFAPRSHLGGVGKHKRKIYGTYIYVCEKCYVTELEKFTSDIDKTDELIVTPPIKELSETM
jgi:hypothetical protein